MDAALKNLDWSLVSAFLAVADTGSLSAAARDLHITQPTIGRQIKALEAQLGLSLFQRNPRGLSLTDMGAALVPAATAMRDAANDIALTAAGQTTQLAGTVRVTASVAASVYHLPAIVADIRAAEPQIGQAFVTAAARILSPSGGLWMVANRHLPYEAELKTRFAQVTEIGGDARFKLFHAARPIRMRRRG